MTPHEIQMLRRRLRFTQRQLAKAINVTETTIARWERGARTATSLAATCLTLLAKLHGVDPRPPARRRKAS